MVGDGGLPPLVTVTGVYQAMNMITYSAHSLTVLTSTNSGDSQ